MGYYSDVALCLTKVGAAQLATAIEARVGSSPENFASSAIKDLIGGEPVCKDAATGAVAFFWSCIKWYADFEAVAFVENFMADLEYEDYYFIRVGENHDDTEVSGGFWDNTLGMCLVRGIAFG